MQIQEIMERWLLERQARHQRGDVPGVLHAGNTGVVTPAGDILASCPRQAILRYRGIRWDSPDISDLIMFLYGYHNEEVWLEILDESLPDHIILQEEEIPTRWEIDGIPVTGRPDMVIVDGDGVNVLGIEHKHVSSLWTALSAGLGNMPKIGHLAQAAHYMWQLGIPYKLIYTCDVNYQSPMWKSLAGKFPAGSAKVHYNERGDPVRVRPHVTVYDLALDSDGVLSYKCEKSERWNRTLISIEGIRDYYSHIAKCIKTDELPGIPDTLEADGQRSTFNLCDYCSLKSICKRGDNLTDFINLVGEIT